MPKLLLINPANVHKGLGNLSGTAWPPLHLPYIAAVTPAHYRVRIHDENVAPFGHEAADLVGITAYTAAVNRAYAIAARYRAQGTPVVMGGIHVSMRPHEALAYCDAVVTGEAEEIWPEVVADFERGRLRSIYAGGPVDLGRLPLPRRDLLARRHYLWGSIQTSRGCPMDCAFCSVSAFNGRRYRRRPLAAVVAELAQIPQRLVMITDDNLIGHGEADRDWVARFFEAVVRRRFGKRFFVQAPLQIGADRELLKLAAAAGVRICFVGIESVNPETLAAYRKRSNLADLRRNDYPRLITHIRRSGIACLGAFVLGGDTDTPRVFAETDAFIRSTGLDMLQVTKPTPLPGTRLWAQMEAEGRIFNRNFPAAWDDYRLTKLVFRPARMSIEEVYRGFTRLRSRYYAPLTSVRRTLRTLFDTRSPTATALAWLINRSYARAFRRSAHYRRYHRPGLGRAKGMAAAAVPVVAGVIVSEGRVLVAQRRDGAMAGRWEFPGGKVEPGETPPTALVRELREELGVTVTVGPRICTVPFRVAGVAYRLIAFYAEHRCGVFLPLDHRRLVWVAPDGLLALDLAPADVPVARRVAAGFRGIAAGGSSLSGGGR